MTITTRPRWSLGRGKPLVPSGWQATVVRLDCNVCTLVGRGLREGSWHARTRLRLIGSSDFPLVAERRTRLLDAGVPCGTAWKNLAAELKVHSPPDC